MVSLNLPTPGADRNQWGPKLNQALQALGDGLDAVTATANGAAAEATAVFRQATRIVAPEEYGAAGDGVGDDWAALELMMDALRDDPGITPANIVLSGVYRIGRGVGRTAGLLLNRSHLTVTFLPGAKILMDNLNPSTGNGDQAHGIVITGAIENVRLNDAHVEWATYATARSTGDGIRVAGSAVAANAPHNVHLAGRTVCRNCPQTGTVWMGAAGELRVDDITVENTRGDGVHFNANHTGPIVGTVRAIGGVTDDCLAFVTYYHPTEPSLYGGMDTEYGPFNSPDLTTRNNVGARAGRVIAAPGTSNGVRVAGGYDIQVDTVSATGRKSAVEVGAGIVGVGVGQTHMVSRKIRFGSITADSCNNGVTFNSLNVPDWRTNDDFGLLDVTIGSLVSRNSTQYGALVSKTRGVTIEYADFDDGDELRLHDFARVRVNKAVNVGLLTVSGSSVAYTAPLSTVMDDHQLDLTVSCVNANIFDVRNARLNITSTNAPTAGIFLWRVRDCRGRLDVVNHNRTNSATSANKKGVRFNRVEECEFDVDITSDTIQAESFEIGGGTAVDARGAVGLRIRAVWRSAQGDGITHGVVLQGGGNGATLTKYTLDYKHSGATTPAWAQSVL